MKTVDKYFLMEIITLTIQTPMSGLKLVKSTISQSNKALSEKFGSPYKSLKSKTHVCFFKQTKTKFSDHKSENVRSSVF